MANTELVFVPNPGMGHLLSMVEVAKLIIKTNQNISITVIIFHVPIYEPTKVEDYVKSESRKSDPNKITFITVPSISNLPDASTPDFYTKIIELNKQLVKQVVQDRGLKPAAFVLDLMNVTMIDIADELNVPAYIYFPAGANLLYTMFHFQVYADEHGVDDIIGLVDELDDANPELALPGFRNKVPAKVIPWAFLDKENEWPSLILSFARRFREAKGILVNTFMELDSCVIHALLEFDNIPTIYPVGPILSLDGRGDSGPSKEISSKNEGYESIMSWLDEQPPSSVVFLCFGSMGCFGVEQVKEIAIGLERSGHRFLWSLRKTAQAGVVGLPSEHEIFKDALPEGFLDRTTHRGKLIAWAPQMDVLAHKAIGGFVSHCGWNSILESMWFGVPIATWPMYSEQQMNAFTLVKELGIAVEISLDYRYSFKKQDGTFLVTADEVENGVKKLMSMDEEMRRKLHEMSDKCKKVLKDGGSSHRKLADFIHEVTESR